MRTFRWHRCRLEHLSARTFLQCSLGGLFAVQGSGSFAVLSWCTDATRVIMRATAAAAAAELARLDEAGCDGVLCTRRHEVAWVDHRSGRQALEAREAS